MQRSEPTQNSSIAKDQLNWFCWTGAAEEGRAPTEERSYIWPGYFCSTRAPEDTAIASHKKLLEMRNLDGRFPGR